MQQHQRVRHPVSAASSASHMSSVSSSQRMRCAQCWMLDCTIPAVSTGEAVIRSRLEEPPCSLWRGRGHCSALWRSLLHSSPFCRVSPSFSLICSLPARWGWSAAHTPPGSSHRIVHPPTKPQLSRHDTADLFTLFFPSSQMSLPGESTACTPVRWRARACSHQRRRRIYLRVRCPHTVRAISPPRTQTWTSPIVTEEEKGKHTGLQGWGSTAL